MTTMIEYVVLRYLRVYINLLQLRYHYGNYDRIHSINILKSIYKPLREHLILIANFLVKLLYNCIPTKLLYNCIPTKLLYNCIPTKLFACFLNYRFIC